MVKEEDKITVDSEVVDATDETKTVDEVEVVEDPVHKFAIDNNLDDEKASVFLQLVEKELKGNSDTKDVKLDVTKVTYEPKKFLNLGNPFNRPDSPHQQLIKKFATFGGEGRR